MLSLIWNLYNNQQNNLSKIILSKYGQNHKNRKYSRSYSFKSIQQTLPLFQQCTRMIIGKGNNTSFWYDCWLTKPLRLSFIGPLPKSEENRNVNTIIKNTQNKRHWDLQNLPPNLPINITLKINSQPLSQQISPPEDTVSWDLTSSGLFTSKSAYQKITERQQFNPNQNHYSNVNSNLPTTSFSWLWENNAHPREKLFLWQIFNKGLPTNKNLKKRLQHISDFCCLCNQNPESHIIILRDCTVGKDLWETPYPPVNFFTDDYKTWIYKIV